MVTIDGSKDDQDAISKTMHVNVSTMDEEQSGSQLQDVPTELSLEKISEKVLHQALGLKATAANSTVISASEEQSDPQVETTEAQNYLKEDPTAALSQDANPLGSAESSTTTSSIIKEQPQPREEYMPAETSAKKDANSLFNKRPDSKELKDQPKKSKKERQQEEQNVQMLGDKV